MDQRRFSHLSKLNSLHPSSSTVSQMVALRLPKLRSPTSSPRKDASKKLQASQAGEGSASQWDASSTTKAAEPRLLAVMPQDIIQEVFLHLDVPDVLSLAQVSRLFYAISQSTDLWRSLACRMLLRGRHIALYESLSAPDATMRELRESVVAASAAESVWSRQYPRSVGSGPARRVSLDDVDLDHASYLMKFNNHSHLVLPTKGGRLVGWDMRTGARAGEYFMGADTVLINVQGDYKTRSLYWILGKMSSEIDLEQNLQLKLIRIQFPEPQYARTHEKTEPIVFEELVDLVTPWSLAAELHILDVSQRMFCAVFEHGPSGTTGIHVVLDWDQGTSFICDTGIPYAYGRSVTGLQLSEDKTHLILRSEQGGSEERRAFSIAHMWKHASNWKTVRALEKKELALLDPVASATCRWEHDRAMFSDHSMTPHTVWVLPQYWPTMPGIPRLTSTIVLFFSCQETEAGTVHKWCAAQHYTRSVESDLEGKESTGGERKATTLDGGAPCSAVRSVIEMDNPVLISLGHHGLPILAQSFNHLGWIEEAEADPAKDNVSQTQSRLGRLLGNLRPRNIVPRLRRRVLGGQRSAESSAGATPKRRGRQLKLVTFPDPGESAISPSCRCHAPSQPPPSPSECSPVPSPSSEAFIDRLLADVSTPQLPSNPTLADLSTCTCTTLKPVTLDVPSEVLDRTYHMFLDSAAGSVMLATEDNQLYEYRYGRARALDGA